MGDVKAICAIALYNLRKWAINPRIYLIFVMVTLYLHSILSPIRNFCVQASHNITPYVFPFIMSHTNSILLIMLGIALLFCDAPFIEIDQPYIIMRSGRTVWALGNLLYMLIASFIYFFFVLTCSIALLSPYLEFSLDWGRVIGTFAQSNVAPQQNIFVPFSFTIYNAYTPIAALLISFSNCCLIAFIVAMLMFVLNMNYSRFSGILAAAILLFWQVVVTNTWTGFTKFSPVTWVSLSSIDTNGSTLYPSLLYIHTAIVSMVILLSLLCVFSIKKRDIDILKSV